MTDSTQLAFVAESIERLSGGEIDTDDATDFAYNLLHEYPTVQAGVLAYMDSTIGEPELDAVVNTAVHNASR